MCNTEVRRTLTGAFREVTLALTGVFDLYDPDPGLVTLVAETLGKVFRARLQRTECAPPPAGRAAMEALLDEVDSVAATGGECQPSARRQL